jgi:tetratricopeptide (TPR) repeat protein
MRFVSQNVSFKLSRRLPICLALISLCASTPSFAEYTTSAFDQGRERMSRRDYDGAIMSFGESIGFSAENPKAYLMRGQCFFHLKNYQQALDDFSHASMTTPNVSEIYLWRGNTYASMGQDDNAIVDYQKAIKLDPNLAKQYFAVPPEKRNVASAAKKPGTSHAVDLYKQAMDKSFPTGLTPDIAALPTPVSVVSLPVGDDPSKSPAVITTSNGTLEETTGKTKKKAVKAAKKVDENFDQVGHDKFKKDIDQYTEALKSDNGNASNYFHRGRAHQYLREYDQALQDFSDAIRLNPQNSQFYLARASIYMLIKKPLLAKADVKSAQSVDPTVPAKVLLDLEPPTP